MAPWLGVTRLVKGLRYSIGQVVPSASTRLQAAPGEDLDGSVIASRATLADGSLEACAADADHSPTEADDQTSSPTR